MAAPIADDVRLGVVYDSVNVPVPGDVRLGVVYDGALPGGPVQWPDLTPVLWPDLAPVLWPS